MPFGNLLLGLALAPALICGLAGTLAGQTYPARTITLIVPNLPGGSSDLIARAIGAKLQDQIGRPVIIENKPGASEMIATEQLVRSVPDGHTIAIFSNALAINETLSPTRRYDAQCDLVPVAKLAELPFALIVRAALPVHSVKELVAFAKANPGKLSYAHVGVGAPHFLTMEWFKRAAGIDLVAVPYKSSPPVYAGLIGGEVDMTMAALGGAVQFIESGQVRPLAAMSPKRPSSLPQLPTVAESGYPEFELVPWMGKFAAAGTSSDIVHKLQTEIIKAASSADVTEQLKRIGLEASPQASDEFGRILRRDIQDWAKVIADVGVKPQ